MWHNYMLSKCQLGNQSKKEKNIRAWRHLKENEPASIYNMYSSHFLKIQKFLSSKWLCHYVCNLFLHSHMLTRDHPLILLITDMSEFNVNTFCAIVDLFRLDECHDLAKQLSHFLFFIFFSFLLFSQIITKVEHGKASHDSHTQSQSQHVMRQTHDGNNMRIIGGCCTATRVKCISNVQNQMKTLSGSPCQL